MITFEKQKNNSGWLERGKIVIDNELTLYYQIRKGNSYFETFVSDKLGFPGTYWECETLLDTIEEAEKAIENFIELVKSNPGKYKE